MQVKTITKKRLRNKRDIVRDRYIDMTPWEVECYVKGINFMLQFLHTSPIIAYREAMNETKRSDAYLDKIEEDAREQMEYTRERQRELDNVETWDNLKPIASGDWLDDDIPW